MDTCVIILALISEQLGAQCSQALSHFFHAYIGCDLPSSVFSIVKKLMKCVVCFSCYKYLCCPDLRSNQPYHQFPENGMSGTPDCADVGPKLWLNTCKWSEKMAFHPWPEVFGLNTTNTACFVPTCKRALMVAAFTKMLSFLVPLYEAENGMTGPRHGNLAWLSYLTLAGLLFAVALWMYSCVQGKLHVAPCWD